MEGIPPGNCYRLLLIMLMLAFFHFGCRQKKLDPIDKDQSIGQSEEVTFSQPSVGTECYDFVEVTLNIAKPAARNPFTDVAVSGHFSQVGQGNDLMVDGFCDSHDGSIFRVRFMPSQPGDYTYSITYRHGDFERVYNGSFKAVEGKRSGILRVDSNYPWHFIWEGTREHYFNGTTAFWVMGWRDERIIDNCLDRLRRLGHMRVAALVIARHCACSQHAQSADHQQGRCADGDGSFECHVCPRCV